MDLSFLSSLLDLPCFRSLVAGGLRETPTGARLSGENPDSYWVSRIEYSAKDGFRKEIETLVRKVEDADDAFRNFVSSGGTIEIYLQLPGSINNGGIIESKLLTSMGQLGIRLLIEVFPKAFGT
jgi:hypothetical protein